MNDACDEFTHTANRMGIVNLQMSIILFGRSRPSDVPPIDGPSAFARHEFFFRVLERLRINVAS